MTNDKITKDPPRPQSPPQATQPSIGHNGSKDEYVTLVAKREDLEAIVKSLNIVAENLRSTAKSLRGINCNLKAEKMAEVNTVEHVFNLVNQELVNRLTTRKK